MEIGIWQLENCFFNRGFFCGLLKNSTFTTGYLPATPG